MCVYYFWCYWPSNLAFVVRCVTYVPNLRMIRQKLRSLLWTNGNVNMTDRQTDTHTERQKDRQTDRLKWLYICPVPCIALDKQTTRKTRTLAEHCSVWLAPPWTWRANCALSGARYDGWNTTSQHSSENASTVPLSVINRPTINVQLTHYMGL